MSVKFFFYKQETAYDMRISDWSSDVCSSDLPSAKRETGDGGEEWAVKILGEIAGTDPAADQRGQHEARARLDAVAAGVALRLKRLAIAIVAAVERSDGEDRAFGPHLIFGRQFGGGEGAVAEALDRKSTRLNSSH